MRGVEFVVGDMVLIVDGKQNMKTGTQEIGLFGEKFDL